jgi:hypothetical protein
MDYATPAQSLTERLDRAISCSTQGLCRAIQINLAQARQKNGFGITHVLLGLLAGCYVADLVRCSRAKTSSQRGTFCGTWCRRLAVAVLCVAAVDWLVLHARTLDEARAFVRAATAPMQPVPRVAEGFSIVISTYRRDNALFASTLHYMQCAGVAAVHVVWHDNSRRPPMWLRRGAAAPRTRLRLEQPTTNLLTNRFLPLNFSTRATFSTDDDMIFSCARLGAAHRIPVAALLQMKLVTVVRKLTPCRLDSRISCHAP